MVIPEAAARQITDEQHIVAGSGSPNRRFRTALSAAKGDAPWIPTGFAHDFLTPTKAAVQYSSSDYYALDRERTLLWDDPEIAIEWPPGVRLPLSPEDSAAPSLAQAEALA